MPCLGKETTMNKTSYTYKIGRMLLNVAKIHVAYDVMTSKNPYVQIAAGAGLIAWGLMRRGK